MDITFKSNFGNFDYQLRMEVADDTNETIANVLVEALANLGFRACGSNVEKALVKSGAMLKDDKRIVALYDDENAVIVATAAQSTLDKICKDESYPKVNIKVLGQHEFGATAPTKEATALWVMVCKLDGDELEAALAGLGLDDTSDEAAGVEACKATLQKAKKDAAAAARAALGLK